MAVTEGEAIGKAAEMSVVFPVEDARPMFDCFIDDLFGVSRERDKARLEAVLPFVLHLLGRTRILTLGDIEFRREGIRIESNDEDDLASADTVSLTFRTQKNVEKGRL
jgi:hypothetical protein